jgi:hypothetical protein
VNKSEIFSALGLADHNSGVFAGEWREATGEQIDVTNPSTGETLASVTMASPDNCFPRPSEASTFVV